MVAYTRGNPTSPLIRTVSITSVDPQNQGAYGTGDFAGQVYIDTSYYVGATSVTPSVGDQWHIQQINGQWRLYSRIAFNDPNQSAVTPTQGQHIVGSGQGPVELQGTQINAQGPIGVAAYTSDTLPDASSIPAGSHVYDTTIGKPVWSNGTHWTDSAGNITIAKIAVGLSGHGVTAGAGLTSQIPDQAPISGHGLLSAAIKVNLAQAIAGNGRLSMVGKYPFWTYPAPHSQGRLVVSGGQKIIPAFSGHGAMSGSGTSRFSRSTSLRGIGGVSAARVRIPALTLVGTGYTSTGAGATGSYTDTIPVGTTCAMLFVAVVANPGSLNGVSATIGGNSMTLTNFFNWSVTGGGTGSGYYYIAGLYLDPVPTGTQTVQVTISSPGGTNAYYMSFNTLYYANSGAVGSTTTTGGDSSSINSTLNLVQLPDNPAPTTQLYASAHTMPWINGGTASLKSYTGNTLWTTNSPGEFTHPPLLIGDAFGDGVTYIFPGAEFLSCHNQVNGTDTVEPFGAVCFRLNG